METSLANRFEFASITQLAECVVQSKLFPQLKTKEEALTLMLLCDSE